jgi:hypothetical protein
VDDEGRLVLPPEVAARYGLRPGAQLRIDEEANGCNLSETNEEACFGNPFPTCGGCLWAQGVIQCP